MDRNLISHAPSTMEADIATTINPWFNSQATVLEKLRMDIMVLD
jgi:hypothetical protein